MTYGDLQPALAREGMRLSTSLLPRTNKSVVASLLEREPRLNCRYQWSSLDPLRCLEIIWGDGNKLWTGDAGHDIMNFENQWEQEHDASAAADGDCMMGGMAGIGGGGFTAWENFVHFDSHDAESVKGTYEYFESSSKFGRENGLGTMERMYVMSRCDDGYTRTKEEQERMLSSSAQPLAYEYQWKIRSILDPNHLGDTYYMTLEPKKITTFEDRPERYKTCDKVENFAWVPSSCHQLLT